MSFTIDTVFVMGPCSAIVNSFGSTITRDLLDSVSGGAERPNVNRRTRCIRASWGFSLGYRDIRAQAR
jgi:hypothetical protein